MSLPFRAAIAAFLLVMSAPHALAHDAGSSVIVQVTDLGHGIYELRTDQSGNVAVLIGEDGVLMIDTQMEHLVEAIDESLRELSGGRGVELILNTHLHRDHVRGNAYYAERGAQIMAHPNVRKYLEQPRAIVALGREAPGIGKEYLPAINLVEGSSITMNGQTGRLYHTPEAHTDGDLFIHFEEANIIHAGDLLESGRFPFIDIDNGGTVAGYIAGMEKILEVADEETVIIAGHGPNSTEKEVKASIAMLKETYSIVADLVEQDLTLDEILNINPLSDYSDAWDWEFIDTRRMTTILYYDLTGKLS